MSFAQITAAGEPARRYRIWLVASLTMLLGFRLVALAFNASDLFFDEAQYWAWSRELDWGYFSKPPVIAWVIRAASLICGDTPFCVRVASPVIHMATAALVFLIGQKLYGAQIGFWSAIVFATLPGISLSASIVSTDVPLLFFWALALFAFTGLVEARSWSMALLLGFAMGGGMLAKYAMVYFIACGALYLLLTPDARPLLKSAKPWLALAVAGLMIAPNIVWNLYHGSVTFTHTAANAKWGGELFHPGKTLEFLAAQLGVFGPILFVAFLVVLVRAWRSGLNHADRYLFFFSGPIVALITLQALLSRAHANWAAAAYVAAAILITATMLRERERAWFSTSLGLHLIIMVLLAVGLGTAGRFTLPGGLDPLARVLGWKEIARLTGEHLITARKAGTPFSAILTDNRAITAELIYYLRDEPTPIFAVPRGTVPHDHFELTRPFTAARAAAMRGLWLLVSFRHDASHVADRFAHIERLAQGVANAGQTTSRIIYFYRASGMTRAKQ